MGKNTSQNKVHRNNCLMHAASDVVKILEANGWKCFVVGRLAAMLHGSPKVPMMATLAVLKAEGATSPSSPCQILLNSPGQKFQLRKKKHQDVLVYRDPESTSSDTPVKRECKVHLTLMDRILPGYRQHELQRVGGFPVVPFLPLLVYEVEAILQTFGQGWVDQGEEPNVNVFARLPPEFKKLLKLWKAKDEITLIEDEGFTTLSIALLSGLSGRQGFHPFVGIYLKQLESIKQKEREGEQQLPPSAILDGKDAYTTPPIPESVQDSTPSGLEVRSKRYQNVGEAAPEQPSGTTQAEAIFSVAVKVVQMLSGLKFRCAILGPVLTYEGDAISNKLNIAIFHPTNVTPSDVRRTLMTSLWYHHFNLKGTGENETLFFQLKTISMKLDAILRNMVAINIFTPASLNLPMLREDQIVDLPVIPSSVLSALGFKDANPQAFEGAASSGTGRLEEQSQVSFNSDDARRLKALFESWNSLGGHRSPSWF